MGYRSKDYILRKKIKYGVVDKVEGKIIVLDTQKSVADLLKVSRKTIYRGLPYETSQYVVYSIEMSL